MESDGARGPCQRAHRPASWFPGRAAVYRGIGVHPARRGHAIGRLWGLAHAPSRHPWRTFSTALASDRYHDVGGLDSLFRWNRIDHRHASMKCDKRCHVSGLRKRDADAVAAHAAPPHRLTSVDDVTQDHANPRAIRATATSVFRGAALYLATTPAHRVSSLSCHRVMIAAAIGRPSLGRCRRCSKAADANAVQTALIPVTVLQ